MEGSDLGVPYPPFLGGGGYGRMTPFFKAISFLSLMAFRFSLKCYKLNVDISLLNFFFSKPSESFIWKLLINLIIFLDQQVILTLAGYWLVNSNKWEFILIKKWS